jgi:exonuclease SbcC
MQIISLRLKNIKSHRDRQFSFAPGINVLAGPNGAGKSTVFEAIGYALFGVDARDIVGRADRFLTLGASRGEVEVVFRSTAGELWRVTRTVGANARWLLAQERGGSFETEEHARAEETEERLRQILGLDRTRPLAEQFRQVIGPLQSDFLGPFVLRGAKRQEAFDRILGIDGWRRTFEGTLDLQKALQSRIACLQAEIAGRAEQLAVLPDREGELQAVRRQEKAQEKVLRAGEGQLAAAEGNLAVLEMQRQELEKAEEEARRLADRIAAGAEKIVQQRERVTEAAAALQVVEESRPGQEAFESAENALKGLRVRERERQAAEREVHLLERECDRLRQRLELEVREVAASERQIVADEEKLATRRTELQPAGEMATLAHQLPSLRRQLEMKRGERALLQGKRDNILEGEEQLAGGTCPFLGETCGNLASAEISFVDRLAVLAEGMAVLKGEIERLDAEAAAADRAEKTLAALAVQTAELARQQSELAARRQKNAERSNGLQILQPEKARAESALAEKQRWRTTFAGLDSAIAAAEAECDRYRESRDRYHSHLGTAGDLDDRRQILLRYEQLLAELKSQQEEKTAALQALRAAYAPQAHAEASRGRDLLLATIAALRQEVKGLAEQGGRLAAEIDNLRRVEAEVAARRAAIGRLQEQEQLVKYLRTHVFNQVSARLSERFREEISQRADRLYRTIAETDEELVWGDGYQVVLRDLQDGEVRERSDEQLSGGQTMSAVVALRLALLQTIGARLAFFDEPTSSLDAGRRENLARAFRAIDIGREEVAEHWYDQLFLISHDVSFAEITDQIIALGEGAGVDAVY